MDLPIRKKTPEEIRSTCTHDKQYRIYHNYRDQSICRMCGKAFNGMEAVNDERGKTQIFGDVA